MERMEHFHGKLLEGDRVLLDDVDGYIGHHERKKGVKSYFGYFEFPADKSKAVDGKSQYKLVLDDGRFGSIFTDILPTNHPGKVMAEFHITGNLRK